MSGQFAGGPKIESSLKSLYHYLYSGSSGTVHGRTHTAYSQTFSACRHMKGEGAGKFHHSSCAVVSCS